MKNFLNIVKHLEIQGGQSSELLRRFALLFRDQMISKVNSKLIIS